MVTHLACDSYSHPSLNYHLAHPICCDPYSFSLQSYLGILSMVGLVLPSSYPKLPVDLLLFCRVLRCWLPLKNAMISQAPSG